MEKQRYLAIILEDDCGRDPNALSASITKPMIPYGDRHKLIDFSLSNCRHSGVPTVVLFTQAMHEAVHNYVGAGKAWGLDRPNHKLYVRSGSSRDCFKGSVGTVFQNSGFIDSLNPEYVIILCSDQIYRMNYRMLLEHHVKSGCEATVAVAQPGAAASSRFGYAQQKDDVITAFGQKPVEPEGDLAAMGVYVFNWAGLKKSLAEAMGSHGSCKSFCRDIIPQMQQRGKTISPYLFKDYWKDAGTLQGLWEANLDLLGRPPKFKFQNKYWEIYTAASVLAPQTLPNKRRAQQSIVGKHCVVNGNVTQSVLSHSVFVGEGAKVSRSVIMPGAIIGQGAIVENAIIGPYAIVADGASVGQAIAAGEDKQRAGSPAFVEAYGSIDQQDGRISIPEAEALPEKSVSVYPGVSAAARPPLRKIAT